MNRTARLPAGIQPSLDIEEVFDPTSRDALRAAYSTTFFRERGISFEEALADKGLYLCLKNQAEVLHRRLTTKRETTCA